MQVKCYNNNNNNNNSDNNEEMHIIASDRHQQPPPSPDAIILTKCTKMTTEEKQNIRYGMNGNAILDCGVFTKDELSSPVTTTTKTTTTTTTTSYPPGGRLKFFKDGKFILELERAREGERISWVSVPRKTFWPPQGTAASTPTYRQESSTSLSVSDDNSSIQSSPWQRDHSWKQQQPRRNQSDGLSFYFWRHPKLRPQFTLKNKIQIKQKCRRPYYYHNNNNNSNDNNNSDNDDNTTLVKNSVCNNNNDNYQVNNNSNNNNNKHTKLSLLKIIQNLIDSKTINNEKPCNNIVTTTAATCRIETVVSPRKRFLREMEKDKILIDDNCLKRSRNKTPIVTCSGNNNNNVNNNNNNNSGQVTIIKNSSSPPVRLNGDDVKIISSTSSGSLQHNQQQKNCSYSITSLLAEDRAVRRSPNNSPSRYNSVTQFGSSTTTTTTTSSPSSSSSSSSSSTITPGTEDRLYSENVDRLRSIELSQADKRAYQAAAAAAAAAAAYPNYLPFMYPYSLPPQYYNPGMYGGRNYMVPSIYHHHASAPPPPPPPPPPPTLPHHHHHHHHHTPQPPLAPVQMALRHNPIDSPSYSWTTDSIRGTENDQRDDNDMPLNLSKHAG